MALTETLDLDIRAAQNQLSRLNAQLDQLAQPLNIPVNISGEQAAESLRRDLSQADNAVESLNSELGQTDRELDQIRGSARGASDAVLRVGTGGVSAFSNLRGSIIGVVGALGLIAGTGAALRGAFAVIQQASDLEESLSKTNVVFEDFSGNIQDFASTAPRALGLSTAAALESTATFGNLFVALGLTREAAATLSPDIVQLAADLASFNNIAVDEAIEKLRAGLVGEAEPLRTLGVNINAALVDAKALELGLVDVTGTVTEAGKVQARYALILEQTTTAQGDYARTSEGIANTQRTLNAEWENAQTTIGQALLPAYQALLDLMPTVIRAFEDLAPVIASASQSFADGVPTAQQFVDVIQTLSAVPTAVDALTAPFTTVAGVLVGSLQSLTDYEAGNARVNASLKDLSNTIDGLNIEKLRNGLINALQEGRDPVLALADALVVLTTLELDPAALLAEADALTAIAGIDITQGAQVAATLRQFGKDAGLSAPQVLTLTNSVLGFFTKTQEASSRFGEAFQLPTVGTGDVFGLITDSAERLGTTIGILNDFSQAAAQIQFDQLETELQASAQAFVDFADTGQAARDALRDAEGGIVDDFDDFFTNLQQELSSRTAFQDNLTLLRAMGLDDLAATFQELGLESAGALADAIADPSTAAQAEAFLEAQATENASAYNDAFRSELAALLIQQPVDVILGQIQIPDIQAALNIGPIGGGQGVGDVIVNIVNPETNDIVTDSVRAGGIINGVISGQRGAQ